MRSFTIRTTRSSLGITTSTGQASVLLFLGTICLCMRMAPHVDFLQLVGCEARVNLCRRDPLVAEKFLHVADVCVPLQQVRRRGASQHVRMDPSYSRADRETIKHAIYRPLPVWPPF